ncbi:type VII secretion protein EccB [Actinophytocola oryzae]|uniref:Type VII secretion protein EccB n=1 Tax=Actinophytocola oryzae TaxID=502181 RepID=A0A4R7UYC4_9PSEU|nr:type VII secretion protein EccB [Actinophytocola oryzae]TDV40076.1 type VII secretion protein EccB [Actinophytocola oryzae]
MASKRDQLHAYQFLVQRVISALVTRETDPEQPPFRKPVSAAFGGIAIAVIALAAVGVYGVLNPGGNQAWADGKKVIVEEETGTRYVYLDGRLHPVENYTSALLALDDHAATVSVSRDSLSGVPRGPRIGIPDAPDALPAQDGLLRDGWTMCSQPAPDLTGTVVPTSVLMVGQPTHGGMAMGNRAVLADVPETGERYLLLRGYRHLVSKPDGLAVGLALRATPAVRVSPAVIESIPAGRPIAPIPVAGMGQPAQVVRPDVRAGQLFAVSTSEGVQYYLAEVGQLLPITELQYDIQRAYQATAAAYPNAEPKALPMGLIEASGAPQPSAGPEKPGDPPAERPEFVRADDGATVCLTFTPRAAEPTMTLSPVMPEVDPMAATPRRTAQGAVLADRVLVPPGRAAVVEAAPSPDTPRGTYLVVTDQGMAYPLASVDVLKVLGYDGITPVRMPAGLVARIPTGSGLSHEAALQR